MWFTNRTGEKVMTREEFWTWLNTHPLGDYDIHEDDYGAIVIEFPVVEEKE